MEETVVIRSRDAARLSLRPAFCALLPLERAWAKKEAERLLEAARQQAAELLAGASSQAEEIRRAARLQGEHQGREHIAGELADFVRWRERETAFLREAVPRLASRLAERILDESLRLAPELVCSIFRGLLQECPAAGPLRVRVHPRDLQSLLAWVGQRQMGEKITFEPGEELGRGDCLLQGSFGQLDGRLRIRLEVLRQALERMAGNELE